MKNNNLGFMQVAKVKRKISQKILTDTYLPIIRTIRKMQLAARNESTVQQHFLYNTNVYAKAALAFSFGIMWMEIDPVV